MKEVVELGCRKTGYPLARDPGVIQKGLRQEAFRFPVELTSSPARPSISLCHLTVAMNLSC